MKKHHKKSLSFVVIAAAVTTFLLITPSKTTNEIAEIEIEKQTKGMKKDPVKKGPSRSIASLPTPSHAEPTKKKREFIGRVKNAKNVRLVNEESDDWKEKYQHNFMRMLGDQKVTDFKIKLKKSIIKVHNNVGRHLEHVVVSYKKPNGDPFSFEAHIDSATGQVVQTWNKTRYEYREPARLKADGHKFYAD